MAQNEEFDVLGRRSATEQHQPDEEVIDERTGRMIHLKNSCIMLEDVVCTAKYHRHCPRAIYPYWREIWLERVAQPTADIEAV